MTWDAIFFDFDGVLVDSVPLKTEAFARVMRPYGKEAEQAMVSHHLAHGGVSRYEKFRHVFRETLDRDISEEELARLGNQFSDLVRDAVIARDLMPGIPELLQQLQVGGIPLFIVSGTPEKELRDIVEKKNLSEWFKGVFGSPARKGEILGRILENHSLNPDHCLMIGDSREDWEAARDQGTAFLGIVSTKESPFPENVATCATIPTLQEITPQRLGPEGP